MNDAAAWLLGLALVVTRWPGASSSTDTKPQPKKPAPPAKSAIFQAACAGTLVPSTPGTLASAEMDETSGLVVSAKNPGTLWANNDSGDVARLFAISPTGAFRGIYPLAGATALDWEDVAIGPGPTPDTPYLYVGDIGDNAENRPNIVVYRVAEPDVAGDGGTYPLDGVDALTLQYPDGPHDAEALMVDPRSGELYIVVKHLAGGAAGVYRAPARLAAGTTTVLERVGELRAPDRAAQCGHCGGHLARRRDRRRSHLRRGPALEPGRPHGDRDARHGSMRGPDPVREPG